MDSLDLLGDLHDSRITALHWNLTERVLTLQIDDFFSNFLGLPRPCGPPLFYLHPRHAPYWFRFAPLARIAPRVATGDLGRSA